MFKKLKLKFILTNIITSTSIILVTFSSIYFVALNASNGRDTRPEFEPGQAFPSFQPQERNEIAERFNVEIAERMRTERQASLNTLLVTLIVSGIAVEAIVALLSIYLAEKSVEPVRNAYNAQKEFIANASHEIKTPLAVIQANLEASDIKNNKWIDNAMKKAEDLAELNSQLLALASSESIPGSNSVKEFNLKKSVTSCISAFDAKANELEKSITFSFSTPDSYKIKLNQKAFEQILNIYLDNGIKYAKSTVGVSIKKDKISVISDGKPIAKTKLPHLFERFYQADKTTEGVGLGLAIAKSLADKNGWKVYAEVEPELKTNIFILEFK